MAEPLTAAIRPARGEDLPAIQRIVTSAYEKYVARIGKPPGPMLDDHGAHIRSGSIWLAQDGEAVVGLVVLLGASDHLLLDTIAVDPARHGRGIGGALLRFADREAVRRGFSELRLYTHEMMTENLAMYPALGWKETGRGEQDGYRRVYFRKRV